MVCSIVEGIKNHAQLNPEKICIHDSNGSITYGDFYQKIKNNAALLLAAGLKNGDKVVIKSAQTFRYLAAFHAVQLAGGQPVPLEKNVKKERIDSIAEITKATICIGAESETMKNLSYDDFENAPETAEEFDMPDADSVAEILFTTGTTGKSKGVVMSNRANVAVAENVIGGVEMKDGNVEVLPMPFNHSFSLRRYYANILKGNTVVMLDGVIFINKFFDAFDNLGATSAAMAPSALAIVLKLSDKLKQDKLADYKDKIDYLQFGSAHLPEADKKRIAELLPNSRLYNFYGSTEAGCACILNFNSEDNLPYCIGRTTCNSEIVFVDENGQVVETSEERPARLITGGKMLMDCYYEEPELTAETLIDGMVYSNDLGYIDSYGKVFMLGRSDDIIISAGNKIAPSEVEEVCMKYEGIEECAVIGIDDKVAGQVPKIFVVTNDKYDEGEMIRFLSDRLEAFQVPKVVQKLDSIPKTFNGKILRKELRKL